MLRLKTMSVVSFLCLLVAIQAGRVLLAPVGEETITRQRAEATRLSATSTTTSTTTTMAPLLRDGSNFINDEEELQEFLRKSKREIEDSIKLNPQNYANEDMSVEEIMALFERSSKDGHVEDEQICPICKDDLEAEPVLEAPCKHKFHRDCLLNYRSATHNMNCPVCRQFWRT